MKIKHLARFAMFLAFCFSVSAAAAEQADRLFGEAGKKWEEALKIKPDKHEALYNWGVALYEQAKTKTGDEADRLFGEAGKKFEEALRIKPDKHEALNSWGVALYEQAKTKTGDEADRLFEEGIEKISGAEAIKSGAGAYNLACGYALRGDEGGARQWLEKAKRLGTLPSPKKVLEDADLESVRDRDCFKTLIG